MPLRPLKRIVPGGQLSAAEINRALAAAETHDKVTGGRGLAVRHNAGGKQLADVRPEEFWARVDSRLGYTYAWKQQAEVGDGTFVDDSEGQAGNLSAWPGQEANYNRHVQLDTIIRLTQDRVIEQYDFEHCCHGCLVFIRLAATGTEPVLAPFVGLTQYDSHGDIVTQTSDANVFSLSGFFEIASKTGDRFKVTVSESADFAPFAPIAITVTNPNLFPICVRWASAACHLMSLGTFEIAMDFLLNLDDDGTYFFGDFYVKCADCDCSSSSSSSGSSRSRRSSSSRSGSLPPPPCPTGHGCLLAITVAGTGTVAVPSPKVCLQVTSPDGTVIANLCDLFHIEHWFLIGDDGTYTFGVCSTSDNPNATTAVSLQVARECTQSICLTDDKGAQTLTPGQFVAVDLTTVQGIPNCPNHATFTVKCGAC